MRFRPVTTGPSAEPFQSSSKLTTTSTNASSSFRSSGTFRPVNKTSSSNEQDTTTTTPSSKRHKLETVDYPTEQVAVPSKADLKALYQSATTENHSHQTFLDDHGSGLLSLEQVFVPAVIEEEVQALKRVQAKAQRDCPPHVVKALEECRRMIYKSGHVAMEQARAARVVREDAQAKQDAIVAEEKRLAKEQLRLEKEAARQQRREERAVARAAEKERLKQDRKKKLPQNVELWREVAMFTSELTQLEKEESLWKATEEDLKARERELVVREQQENLHEQDEDEAVVLQKHDLEIQVEHAVEDITLSSLRIQQALRLVSDLVVQSTDTKKELYEKYTKDHQFHGYRGVNNPKGLIRALAAAD